MNEIKISKTLICFVDVEEIGKMVEIGYFLLFSVSLSIP